MKEPKDYIVTSLTLGVLTAVGFISTVVRLKYFCVHKKGGLSTSGIGIFELRHKKRPMNKSNFFTGQPIFSQLLKLIPKDIIAKIALEHKADHYCKRFNTYDHLISLLYAIFNDCHSLREVISGMLASEQRLLHLGVKYPPRRSTLSDANNRRSASVFEDIYYNLFKRYACFLPDSRHRRLYIFDSTTISLFQEVLRTGGCRRLTAGAKGVLRYIPC